MAERGEKEVTMNRQVRTFKTVLAEKAKAAGSKSPSEYKAFYDACRYVAEKFRGNSSKDFERWMQEESIFD
jgi:hypothetical protein